MNRKEAQDHISDHGLNEIAHDIGLTTLVVYHKHKMESMSSLEEKKSPGGKTTDEIFERIREK